MGDYFGYIAAAYGISALGIGGLVAWVAVDARRQRRRLEKLGAGRPMQEPRP